MQRARTFHGEFGCGGHVPAAQRVVGLVVQAAVEDLQGVRALLAAQLVVRVGGRDLLPVSQPCHLHGQTQNITRRQAAGMFNSHRQEKRNFVVTERKQKFLAQKKTRSNLKSTHQIRAQTHTLVQRQIHTFCLDLVKSHSKVADCFSTVTWSSRGWVTSSGNSVMT